MKARALWLISLVLAACEREDERLAGGATTLLRRSPDVALSAAAFSQPAANLDAAQRTLWAIGNSLFSNAWVAAPAAASGRDGLGPLFNASACQHCHVRDGRGVMPGEFEGRVGPALLRLGAPSSAADRQGRRLDSRYGAQLQDRALPGLEPEADPRVRWERQNLTLADGTRLQLRRPEIEAGLRAGPLDLGIALSLRVAQPMIGLGLLEAIDEADLQRAADPDDADGDGIRGRLNRVWDLERGAWAAGRFGWKAGQPSVRQQAAHAAALDLGLSSVLLPDDDCTAAQLACHQAARGGDPELATAALEAVSFYSRHLAVPERRWLDTPEVRAGRALFARLGCAGCHTPRQRTRRLEDAPALSEQVIHPYTDLLLHDLGEGLADGVPEFAARGRDWRTPPLWGLHLTAVVSGGRAGYLHDGRARNLEEAIAWHGGEAQAARDAFLLLARAQREQLLWFLKSL